eukprot:COSAG01_NODE_199_length_22202_cov_23.993668_14_plen_133_part_00
MEPPSYFLHICVFAMRSTSMRATDTLAPHCHAHSDRGRAGATSSTESPPVPDFIGTVDNMKEILKMPYSQDPVTLAVYRVGRTLVMDDAGGGRPTKGTLDVPGSSTASASSPSTSSTSRHGRRRRGGGSGAA